MDKIKQFIEDNKLDFTDSGSSLNSNCVVIAGYACYLGLCSDELVESVNSIKGVDVTDYIHTDPDNYETLESELRRVFAYADVKNYGEWWTKADASKMYKF